MKKLRLKYALLLASALFAPSVSVNAGSLKIFLTAIMAFTVSSSTEFSQNGDTIDDPYAAIQNSSSSGFTSIEGTDQLFLPQNEFDNLVSDGANAHSMPENLYVQQTVDEKRQPPSGLSSEDSAKKLAETNDAEIVFRDCEIGFDDRMKPSDIFLLSVLYFNAFIIHIGVITFERKQGVFNDKSVDWYKKNCTWNTCCKKISHGKHTGCDAYFQQRCSLKFIRCCTLFCNRCPTSCKEAYGCEDCCLVSKKRVDKPMVVESTEAKAELNLKEEASSDQSEAGSALII